MITQQDEVQGTGEKIQLQNHRILMEHDFYNSIIFTIYTHLKQAPTSSS